MSGVTWVYIMLGVYIIYCFYWGLKGYFLETISSEYRTADRTVPFFAFLLAGTATSFSGWTFIGHPGLIWRDGLAYAFASFYVLAIPISGVFFTKRTWLLGKRYGFITPGDMYAYYYNSEAVRWLVVLTAVLYSVFYTAVQFMAAGALFNVIAGVPYNFGAIFLAFIVWFYVCTGGLRASTWVGVIQFILLVSGIVILGFYVLDHFGGWSSFVEEINKLDAKYLKVPGVIQLGISSSNHEITWTSAMILTYLFAMMGIQASPAFTMWTFSVKSPRPFAWQQAYMSTFVVGFALFFFTTFQGMGARILHNAAMLAGDERFAMFKILTDRDVVPLLMKNYLPPFMLGIVFIGAIAAIHSTAAPFIGTGGSILLRDVFCRYIKKQDISEADQIWFSRILSTGLTILALIVAMTSKAPLVILGAFATAFAFVMYLLLLGVIWGFRVPAKGAVIGVAGGIIAVFLTYKVFPNPLSMHPAFWGLLTAVVITYICRTMGFKEHPETLKRQDEIRQWLDSVDKPGENAKKWRYAMKIITPLWFFFAIGPGCILGNNAFSFCKFPPVWSWQIAWWILGIVMMWALCFKAEMSTSTEAQIKSVEEDKNIVVKLEC